MKRLSLWLAAVAIVTLGAGPVRGQQVIDPWRPSLTVKHYELNLKRLGFAPEELSVHSIGQSHIDAAWRWRVAQTHDKVYKTWSNAIKHMELFPGFTFSGSAPQYYEWILNDHPELFEKIREREKEGRWEIVGGQWVEPDGNMPDGESMVRQRLLGQRFYLEHFGKISEVGWMLDSFGYNRNYPQIMARSGAKYMWTSKLTWNDTTVFPFHNFWWQSPDGSRVLTHICPISPGPLYFPFQELGKYKHTRYLIKPGVELRADYSTRPEEIEAALSGDWLNEIGVFYGWGDGGHGPRKTEIRVQRELVKKGYSKFSTGLEFFRQIEKCGDRLPVWDDEMYLEYHRGVLTTQSWIKRANRRTEQELRSAETLRSVLYFLNVKYPYEQLKDLWKLALLNQFHDILPGCSIVEVFEDAKKDYARIFAATREITHAGMNELARRIRIKPDRGEDAVVVWNALPWQRSGLVRLDLRSGTSYEVRDKDGFPVVSQELEREGKKYLLFTAEDMPSIGYRVYYVKPLPRAPIETLDPELVITEEADHIALENDKVRVSVNRKTGDLVSMFDKGLDRELLSGPSNRLLAFYDRPTEYSAWNINPNYLKRPLKIEPEAAVEVTLRGPLFIELLVRRQARMSGRLTTFEQRIRLAKGDPVVYLDFDSDFRMHDALVKLEFNTVIHGEAVAAENAYLVVERPTQPQTEAEKARWEMPCQKWISLADDEIGLTLLNNGKYGFSLNPDGTGFRMTLVKSARHPKASFEAVNVKHHYYSPFPTPLTDQGPQRAELGLMAHAGGWREARLWEAGYNFNTPLDALWTTAQPGERLEEGSFIRVDSDSVIIGAMKRAEDDGDLVLRLVEFAGNPATAVINFDRSMKVVSVVETDLLELNPEPISGSGESISVELGPYEIKTVKVRIKRDP